MKSMLTSALLMVLSSAALAAPMTQKEGLSGSIDVTSLYKLRGIDQDNRSPDRAIPALQGQVQYQTKQGLYAGAWGSTGKFGQASAEVDVFGGYRNHFGPNIQYDIGLKRYAYSSDISHNWSGDHTELYGKIGKGPYSLEVTRGFTSGVNKNDTYVNLGYWRPINAKWDVLASVGYTNLDHGKDYGDYTIGAVYKYEHGLSVTGKVSGSLNQDATGTQGRNRFIVNVSKAF